MPTVVMVPDVFLGTLGCFVVCANYVEEIFLVHLSFDLVLCWLMKVSMTGLQEVLCQLVRSIRKQ